MDHEPDERRAMVRVARLATERSQPARPESRPSPRGPATVWEQTIQAATGWMYLAPLLCVSPFLWNPPLWIMALAQLSERTSKTGPRR